MPQLDNEQRKIVRLIKAEGRNIRNPQTRKRYVLAAVQTGLVESNLHNVNYGDADSKGWRQERASLYPNPTNLRASIRRFRQEFEQQYNPGEASYEVAAQVQRPAAQYRGRYRDVAGQARRIAGNVGGGPSTPTPSSGSPSYGAPDGQGRQQALLSYLHNRHQPNALLDLKTSLDQAQGQYAQPTSPSPAQPQSSGPRGQVTLSPGADRPGVKTRPHVLNFLGQVAGIYGQPLTVGTGSNHNQMTTTGNVSDHWTGRAADVPASGAELTRLGQAALVAAGMSRAQARKAKGGVYNLTWHGRRVQVLFNTNTGGNHFNHLHVGISAPR